MNTIIKSSVFLPILLMAFAFAHAQAPEQEMDSIQRKYVKVEVDGLACPFCAYGLEKKLTNIKGQKDLHIDIQNGFATFHVPDDSAVTKADLRKMVENAGFSARQITFAQEPFVKDQRKDE